MIVKEDELCNLTTDQEKKARTHTKEGGFKLLFFQYFNT